MCFPFTYTRIGNAFYLQAILGDWANIYAAKEPTDSDQRHPNSSIEKTNQFQYNSFLIRSSIHIGITDAYTSHQHFICAGQCVVFIQATVVFDFWIVQFECDRKEFIQMLQKVYRVFGQRPSNKFRYIFLAKRHVEHRKPLKCRIDATTTVNLFQ